jgi:Phosphotransferase enzyme family
MRRSRGTRSSCKPERRQLRPSQRAGDTPPNAQTRVRRDARLYEAVRQDDEIGAVRPIATLPEHRTLVTEEVAGRSFAEYLKQADSLTDEMAACAARVGWWVRTYQGLLRIEDVVRLDERRQYLDARLRLLKGRVLSAADRRQTLARFDELADLLGIAVVPAVTIHADFSPTNIIVSGEGRVTVLDFTMAKTGTRLHDLTHAHFHLELLAARHRRREAIYRKLQDAMLAGFDPRLDAGDPLFRMMLLQHAVYHVALLAERRIPLVERAYRWFLRRRWQVCARMPERQRFLRVA